MASVWRDISPPPSKRRRISPAASDRGEGGRERSDLAITIYSWNVNGIAPFIQRPITSFFKSDNTSKPNTPSKYGGPNAETINPEDERHGTSLRDFLCRHAWPTVLFLQEVKINPDDQATIAAVESAVRRRRNEPAAAPDYRAHFCLPTDPHNARAFGRKVYGVCSIIRADFATRFVETVRPVAWDREGRFLVVETKPLGNDLPKLALINVYAVNGTDNAYRDADTGRPAGTRHDRKLRVHALLKAECARLEGEGFRCVVAGDLNIARAAIDGHPKLRTSPAQHCVNRADFEARFLSAGGKEASDVVGEKAPCLEMVDTFRHLHPQKRGYTYYPRARTFGESCDRVDMVLIGKGLAPYLEAAGMHETPADRGPSDHVPLFATLDFRTGFE